MKLASLHCFSLHYTQITQKHTRTTSIYHIREDIAVNPYGAVSIAWLQQERGTLHWVYSYTQTDSGELEVMSDEQLLLLNLVLTLLAECLIIISILTFILGSQYNTCYFYTHILTQSARPGNWSCRSTCC